MDGSGVPAPPIGLNLIHFDLLIQPAEQTVVVGRALRGRDKRVTTAKILNQLVRRPCKLSQAHRRGLADANASTSIRVVWEQRLN
jgi:hypothetical protein